MNELIIGFTSEDWISNRINISTFNNSDVAKNTYFFNVLFGVGHYLIKPFLIKLPEDAHTLTTLMLFYE